MSLLSSFLLGISVFLPYLTLSLPLGRIISINGLEAPLALIFLLGSVTFVFLTAFHFNKSHFREDFSFSRNLSKIAFILGVVYILFYVLAYLLTIEEIKNDSSSGIDIAPYLSFGLVFYGFILATLINFVVMLSIHGMKNNYPSKWPNRNFTQRYKQPMYQQPIYPNINYR